jgi:hypothetical protein
LTNVKGHAHYAKEYLLRFHAYSDEREITQFNRPDDIINNNLRFDCDAVQSQWVSVSGRLTQDPESDAQQLVCVVQSKADYPAEAPFPKNLTLRLSLSSNSEVFTGPIHVTDRTFEYLWGFQIRAGDNVVKPLAFIPQTEN